MAPHFIQISRKYMHSFKTPHLKKQFIAPDFIQISRKYIVNDKFPQIKLGLLSTLKKQFIEPHFIQISRNDKFPQIKLEMLIKFSIFQRPGSIRNQSRKINKT